MSDAGKSDKSLLVLYRLLDQFGHHDRDLDELFRDAYRELTAEKERSERLEKALRVSATMKCVYPTTDRDTRKPEMCPRPYGEPPCFSCSARAALGDTNG